MEAAFPSRGHVRWTALLVLVTLAFLRVAHIRLLWADEDYHLAAAVQILHGKLPYRDFWFDKPPLAALYYLLIGGHAGWPLRIVDALYILCACWIIYRLGEKLWSPAEGWTAALLLAFFSAFYLPSAVIPFAADAIMLVPHLAAVYCASRGLAVWAGFWSGVALLANIKGLFVLAACAVWLAATDWLLLLLGFAFPTGAALLWAALTAVWSGYLEQVWRWGVIYASQSPVREPLKTGFVRTADWLGFHAALVAGSAYAIRNTPEKELLKLGSWLFLSFAAVCLGYRFAPHYYLQMLPVLVLLGARGGVRLWQQHRRITIALAAVLLGVPLARFGPRYALLAYDLVEHRRPHWSDVVMDLDSQDVAHRIHFLSPAGDTLFVWGYRPNIYVYTRLSSDGPFWDSQPLTGVPADRHLSASGAIYKGPAAANRLELARSHPTFLVDGLSLMNPKLQPSVYPELRPWLAHYRLVDRTKLSLIYERID